MTTIYRCDACGKEFDTWKECVDHENSHIKPKLTKLKFLQDAKYPMAIEVTFDDDFTATYIPQHDMFQKENPLATENDKEG